MIFDRFIYIAKYLYIGECGCVTMGRSGEVGVSFLDG